MKLFRKTLIFTFFLLLCLSDDTEARSKYPFWDYIYQNFKFLPEYHLEADIITFFLHKSSFFKDRYFLENNTNFELELLSFRDFVYSVWGFEFQTGMGQKGEGNVFFDPMEINFGIIPTFEFRTPLLLYQFGLNHHCFHEIDQNEYFTVYWNKLYISVCSNNMRVFDYWLNLTKEDGWTYKNRISWRFIWGYYVRKFFGIIRESTINGGNKYVHDAIVDVRYAFYRRKSWIINARLKTTTGYWKNLSKEPDESGGYYRFDIGIENHFRQGEKGAMVFLIYTIDHLPKYQNTPRFSKDRLLHIGIRFYL